MSPVNHRQMSSRDLYQAGSDAVPTGFLTPPSSHEGRRDSVASSHSSYCQSFGSSEYSTSNDYPMPVTPICGRSPLSEGAFVDGMPYGLVHDLQSQSMHVPLFPQRKETTCTEDILDSYLVFQDGMQSPHQHPLMAQSLVPLQSPCGYGPNMTAHMGEYTIDTTAIASTDPMWDNMSVVAWPDMERTRYTNRHDEDPVHMYRDPLEDARPLWESTSTSPLEAHTVASETTIRADAMLDICVQIDPQGMQNGNALDNGDSLFPQTPQEVSFKREESVNVKTEIAVESGARRRGGRIHLRQTEAKGVKREHRVAKATKPRPTKGKKTYGQIAVPMNGCENSVLVDLKSDIDLDCYATTGQARLKGGNLKERHQNKCQWVDQDTGARCKNAFDRIEHLKRHVSTVHLKHIGGICILCAKAFARNDNCLAHYDTHIRQPGKKDGRNPKKSIRKVLRLVAHDEKVYGKVSAKWARLYEMEEMEGYSSESDVE
ncbi:hypothetical protein K491DRAFT_675063 [Lophiostoma macrostomum CBS 122681]|uniref:C2H2-type domain-containing protein n=1 Tax=Lophiostoma macrostomum CBS 122681 TaxID=1314788 RepID=A0A6A6TKQ1_9PLEO|nr:hypothetical protein K491DRAFT_675063 [Lophiostoma macrostomum CBS 122681]